MSDHPTVARLLVAAIVSFLVQGPVQAADGTAPSEIENRADALFEALQSPERDEPAIAVARAAFAKANLAACPGAVSRIALLPPRADGSRLAYLVSEGDAHRLFAGGHYRVVLATDGTAGVPEVLGTGCETIAWSEDEEDLAVRVAYLQRPAGTPAPNEIDLLLSHRAPFALGMVAAPYVWPLLGGRADQPIEAHETMMATD